MNAIIVYSVVKALSKEEQHKLYSLLEKDHLNRNATKQPKKVKLISRSESDSYILKQVFNKIN